MAQEDVGSRRGKQRAGEGTEGEAGRSEQQAEEATESRSSGITAQVRRDLDGQLKVSPQHHPNLRRSLQSQSAPTARTSWRMRDVIERYVPLENG